MSITGPEHPIQIDHILELGHRLVQSAAIATRQARGRVPSRDLPTATAAGPTRRR
ncbi:hypothetical protein [Pseudofrankia sp. BMG5.36]|uniref:hypothetical protein n=1 Tax=Pseudofrankia sp. BMG5.36 TaxID=1834512 RepID=UPI001F51BAA8|nr:hypothetical protein [Pseudofrankia sp. BMG5.36]